MIKNVIFDFGNVIGRFDYREAVNYFTNKNEEQEFLINEVINSPYWIGLGLLDSGLVSYDSVIKLINDRTNNKYSKLVENFIHEHYKYITISEEITNIIKTIKSKGYNLYILSNTSNEVVNYFKDYEIFKYFDGFVLSYKINMLKPYDGIYNYILNKYNLIPNECLFIDDRNDNIKTAQKFGINGANVQKDNIEDIKRTLKDYDIL